MKLVVCFLLILSSLNVFAKRDMNGDNHRIVVTKYSGERVGFKHCETKNGRESCKRIGEKSSYTIEELEDIKTMEQLEAVGKSVLDVGIVLGVSAAAFFAAPATLIAPALYGAGAGGAAMIGVGVVEKLNPVTQFEQAYVLDFKLMNDVDEVVADAIVLKTVKLLNDIL